MAVSVLIVEDDRNIAELLQMYLEKEGYAVTVAADGGQGLAKFRAIKPDLVLLDVMMPVMDGLTATKTIRALPRPDAAAIPIIAMTANAFQEDAQKCYDAGMNAHIGKPLEMDKVVTVISQFCGCKEDTKKHGPILAGKREDKA